MQQFKIGEDGYKKFRKRWLTIMLPLLTGTAVLVLLLNTYSARTTEVNVLPYLIPILAVWFGFGIFRSLRKQKKLLMSYRLTISEEGITREQMNTPPLSISFMEIKEIIKTKKGGFMIKGVDRTDVILVPYMIDDPEMLEERLQALAPITYNAKEPLYRKYGMVLFALALGMMLCVYTVTNKIMVAICAILLVGLFVWAFYEIRVSKNVPRNAKRSSWFFLIVVVAILYMTYLKLTGGWDPH